MRLKKLMDYYHLTQMSLGESIGVKKSYISQMINDKAPISHQVIDGLLDRFPLLNLNWLLIGEGHIIREKEVEERFDVAQESTAVYNRSTALACLQQLLDDHEERILELEGALQMIRALLEKK